MNPSWPFICERRFKSFLKQSIHFIYGKKSLISSVMDWRGLSAALEG